jgi:hypothetical protein
MGETIVGDAVPEWFAAAGSSKIAVGLLVAAAALNLPAGHEAHVLVVLPHVLLVACPLAHVLVHRGHGGTSSGSHRDERQASHDAAHDSSSS